MSRRRAYSWMVVTWVITIGFIMVLTLRDSTELLAAMPASATLSPTEAQSILLTSALCAVPLGLVVGIAAFAFLIWLVQFVARRLGADVNAETGIKSPIKAKNSDSPNRLYETGTQVTYAFAAIQAPLNIVSLLFTVLPANPIVSVISLAATFYQFYLMVLALRAVYGLSAGRAAGAIFLTFAAFFGLTLGLLSLLFRMA